MNGKLSIVSTPIGNLEDLTLRAARVLREATIIACEDTRHTRKLLEHLGIHTRMVSYHEHNEEDRARELADAVASGERVALVSDAGTPLLSDPGFRLVRAAIESQLDIEVVPGPSALLAALAGSGIGCSTFYFGGFLPAKRGQRAATLEALAKLDAALVFYEAPHRIAESLREIARLLPGREVCAARELTKLHEEWLRGTGDEIARTLEARPAIKGEFTIVVERPRSSAPPGSELSIEEAVEEAMRSGAPRMNAIKDVAKARGLSKRDVYRLIESGKSKDSAGSHP